MLGETDLVRDPLVAGERMASMMAPTVVFERRSTSARDRCAGGTRLRTALVGVARSGAASTARPCRTQSTGRGSIPPVGSLNAEPGVDESFLSALEARGRIVRRWPTLHHYFGGVSAVGRAGAGADPRRSGAVRMLD